MKQRPIIKLELTTTDKAIELLSWISIMAIWLLTIISYTNLPDIIPTHYNAAEGILIEPIIATFIFVGMTILNKFPHTYNYLTEITTENALKHYTDATRLIRYLKLNIVIVFGLILLQTIRHANGQADGLGVWFTPMTIALLFIPIAYYLIKSSQAKK
ncbi:MAG: hypothetical protein IPJ39_02405 [Saprospiraceae bacterium]|nr:hypothetical protein [Saprospiraceae bacterium]